MRGGWFQAPLGRGSRRQGHADKIFRWLFGPYEPKAKDPTAGPKHPLKGTPLYNSFAELEEWDDDRTFYS